MDDAKVIRVYVRKGESDSEERTLSFRTPPEIPPLFWLTEAKGLFPFAIDGNSILTSVVPIVPEQGSFDDAYTLTDSLAAQEQYILKVLAEHGYTVEFV
jgi:hypothetical protein